MFEMCFASMQMQATSIPLEHSFTINFSIITLFGREFNEAIWECWHKWGSVAGQSNIHVQQATLCEMLLMRERANRCI